MPTNIVIPEMGESVTQGVIQTWRKKDGDFVKQDEPLKTECQHFLECIREGKIPLTGGEAGVAPGATGAPGAGAAPGASAATAPGPAAVPASWRPWLRSPAADAVLSR